jgi:hypothetical protein
VVIAVTEERCDPFYGKDLVPVVAPGNRGHFALVPSALVSRDAGSFEADEYAEERISTGSKQISSGTASLSA